ncbi:spore germination protein PF [Cytobacillus eiseniae]|uniref:Spore germination protein PF n=1 Tax=Cytobacillus eiseniae TaxID=762947 RepID=A0ABS4RDY5_9BACI|nr:spore germination protein [Cytobacillus eiseniae]MBP2241117.1 spore germination protein PF [Cytobacillus eiseniae]
MPAIVGPVQILNVAGGIVQFGDSLNMSPKSSSKSVSGQGAGNTGGFIIANNGLSASNVLDSNLIDQPMVGNN